MLDTAQLRSFLAIVDTGSFRRAAERVNKTQSAVSMHVRRLEERFGCPLFVKQGRGATLSPDGERLVNHARRILQAESDAMADLRASGLTGRVTLGMPDDYAAPLLPAVIGRFIREHPLVEVSVICDTSVSLAQRVSVGEIDVAVVTDCDRIKGLEFLAEEPFRWVTGLRAGPVEERRPLPLALSGPSCAWRRAALDALEASGIAVHILLVSNNYAAIAPLIQAGFALTVLPFSVIADDQRMIGDHCGLPLLPMFKIGLLRGTSEHTPQAAALAGAVRKAQLQPSQRHGRSR
jgi:DNA-binding transcriptional LysR family regulator